PCGHSRRCTPRLTSSDVLAVLDGALVLDIAGVSCSLWLKQQDVRLFGCDRAMLDTMRDDQELALFQPDVAVVQLHQQTALHDQEELIFSLVMMPDELAFELDQLDRGIVQLASDFGAPILIEHAKLLRQIHLLHRLRTSSLWMPFWGR